MLYNLSPRKPVTIVLIGKICPKLLEKNSCPPQTTCYSVPFNSLVEKIFLENLSRDSMFSPWFEMNHWKGNTFGLECSLSSQPLQTQVTFSSYTSCFLEDNLRNNLMKICYHSYYRDVTKNTALKWNVQKALLPWYK